MRGARRVTHGPGRAPRLSGCHQAFRSGLGERPDASMVAVAVAGSVLVVTGLLAVIMLVGPETPLRALGVDVARLAEGPVSQGRWALDWGPAVRAPSLEQAAQVGALRTVTGGAALLVTLLAAMVMVGLLRQRDRLRRGDTFVHWAVGARPAHGVARLLGSSGLLGVLLLLFSAAAGVVLPAVLTATFPGSAQLPPSPASALLVATALLFFVARWEGGAAGRSMTGEGWAGRVVSSPTAVASVGFAALSGVGLLTVHAPGASSADGVGGGAEVVADVSLAAVPTGSRGAVLAGWASGVDARSARGARAGLASAGAARGAGHRVTVWVECGACYEGGLPMPVKTVRAETHAVASDTFPLLGLAVLSGRDFDDATDVGAPSVAVVSRSLANRHFESGDAVGRRIRVGASGWLTVVGVVTDAAEARDASEYAVYLPVAQAAPAQVELLAVSSDSDALASWLATAPLGVGAVTTRTRREVFAVHGWFAALLQGVGLLAALLVVVGVWRARRSETRAVSFELALRRALGARRRDLAAYLLTSSGRSLAVALGTGAWLSLFLGAGLEGAYGTIPQIDPRIWGAAAALVTSAWVAGTVPGLLQRRGAPPAEGLRRAESGQ